MSASAAVGRHREPPSGRRFSLRRGTRPVAEQAMAEADPGDPIDLPHLDTAPAEAAAAPEAAPDVTVAGLPEIPDGKAQEQPEEQVQPPTPEPEPAPEPPAAYLRAIMHDGRPPLQEPLFGCPRFAGTVRTPDGRLFAGLCIGSDDLGWFVIDVPDAGWLKSLAGAVSDAGAALAGAEANSEPEAVAETSPEVTEPAIESDPEPAS